MDYGKWITTDAGTAEASAQVTNFPVWAGVVHRVYIYFPAGQEGTHRLRIKHEGTALWPSYQLEHYAGDDCEINFREHYQLHRGLNLLQVESWNTDDNNDHTAFVSFSVLAEHELDPQREFFRNFMLLMRDLGIRGRR